MTNGVMTKRQQTARRWVATPASGGWRGLPARLTAAAFIAGAMSLSGAVTAAATVAKPLTASTKAVGFAIRPGYSSGWLAYTSGAVVAYGGAPALGSAPSGWGPVTGVAATPDGRGYWLVTANGEVRGFGDARAYPILSLRGTVVGIATSNDGRGYLLLTSAGHVYARGDAVAHGDVTGQRGPFTAIVATPDHKGYWLLGPAGHVYSFGDAARLGVDGVNQAGLGPVIALGVTPNGRGYWEITQSGAILSFGDAPRVTTKGPRNVVAIIPSPTGNGFDELLANGLFFSVGKGLRFAPTVVTAPTTTSATTAASSTTTTSAPAAIGAPNPPPLISPTTASTTSVPMGTVTTTTVSPTTTTTSPTTTTTVATTTTTAEPDTEVPPASLLLNSLFNNNVESWPLDPNSSEYAADFVTDYETDFGSVGDSAMPVYTVPADQPETTVSVAPNCTDFTSDTGTQVPIPSYASLNTSSDSPLVVFQPATDSEWELWQVSRQSTTSYTACWGGKLDTATTNGVFTAPYGLAASGISYLATIITEEDVASGSIDHAISVGLPRCNRSVFPASRTDCSIDTGQPGEGQWFRFPPNLAMPSGLNPFAQMVFRAVQTYGMVVTDQSGGVEIETEQQSDWAAAGNTSPNPIGTSWDGLQGYQVVAGLPWSSLQVVDPSTS